jgi:RNA polymerase sigma-70 factor, ECF subfamily
MAKAAVDGLSIFTDKIDCRLTGERTESDVCSVTEPQDEALLVRLQASDTEAVRLLFERYSSLVFSIARRMLRDQHEAEDLVQDVFVFLISRSKSFDPSRGSVRSWLTQITYHRAIDRRRYLHARGFYRGANNGHAPDEARPHINPSVDNPEDLFAWQCYLRPAIEGLSEDQRNTLVLFFYEGYTLREISEKLGQSFGNVQHHFYRGMDRLRRYVFNKNGAAMNVAKGARETAAAPSANKFQRKERTPSERA